MCIWTEKKVFALSKDTLKTRKSSSFSLSVKKNRHEIGRQIDMELVENIVSVSVKKSQNKPYSFKNQENHYHYHHLEKENSNHCFLGHH